MALESFLDKDSQRRVVEAIGVAEKNTSGEVRVHVEPTCKCGNPYERAVEVFNKLEMYRTEARNGVLVYVSPLSFVLFLWAFPLLCLLATTILDSFFLF